MDQNINSPAASGHARVVNSLDCIRKKKGSSSKFNYYDFILAINYKF